MPLPRRALLLALAGLSACGQSPRFTGTRDFALASDGSAGDAAAEDAAGALDGPPLATADIAGLADAAVPADATSSSDAAIPGDGAARDGGGPPGLCPTAFRFQPPNGATNLVVAGEWQGWNAANAPALTDPNHTGTFTATVPLPPGAWAYKFVYTDGNGQQQWVLDPAQGRRKYVNAVENSAMVVPDCTLPSLRVASSAPARPAPGKGSYAARLTFVDAIDGSGPDPAGFTAQLVSEQTVTPLHAPQLAVDAGGAATLALDGLADGKYTVAIAARTKSGRAGAPLRLVFWVEAEAFDWRDALVYMIVTDRYRDAVPGNNPPPTPGADARADWKGGDYQGVVQSLQDGTLDKLGVRALWLTPFNTNPQGAYLAADGVHLVTGYHGYWPTKAREVEPRIGGADGLHALVTEAHKHGIRVLQDYVIHHVHKDHEYLQSHPDWFHQGCLCGSNNCDWTQHAQDCVFADYLPNIDHTNWDADAQFVADAVWWLDTFDLDGLRIDAVKHVPDAATRNLAAAVREGFEASGNTRYFLMGETAMGWNDCADPCNDINYDTISHYIGPLDLDGQFDFVLYHGVSYNTFAYGDKGLIHADYWFNHNQSKWPQGAVMTPYIGSHDTARFTTLADYRGQDAQHDRGIPGNQFSNTAVAPSDGEPYRRTRIAMSWLLGLPGAPLLYYGDEYGQWGGSDPNNRLMWRPQAQLTADEAVTLGAVQRLGTARQGITAMRRGSYVSLYNSSEDTLVFGRLIAPGKAAVVGLTRAPSPQTVTVDLTPIGIAAGTKLHDALGSPDATVAAPANLTLTIPASGSVIYAP